MFDVLDVIYSASTDLIRLRGRRGKPGGFLSIKITIMIVFHPLLFAPLDINGPVQCSLMAVAGNIRFVHSFGKVWYLNCRCCSLEGNQVGGKPNWVDRIYCRAALSRQNHQIQKHSKCTTVKLELVIWGPSLLVIDVGYQPNSNSNNKYGTI